MVVIARSVYRECIWRRVGLLKEVSNSSNNVVWALCILPNLFSLDSRVKHYREVVEIALFEAAKVLIKNRNSLLNCPY